MIFTGNADILRKDDRILTEKTVPDGSETMELAAVVAEYNPFHNGHAYQLSEIRRNGGTHVAIVMSGNVVQRGEVACFSKAVRARAAVSLHRTLCLLIRPT